MRRMTLPTTCRCLVACVPVPRSQVLHTMSNTSIARASVGRSIPSAPLRILDAPDLVDDYYLNLISWGHNNVSLHSLCLQPLGCCCI